MPYATQQDLETRFGADELVERTDRAGGQTIDAAVVAQHLADASAEIDGYLASRYAVPVDPPSAILKALCCDIARYRLHGSVASDGVRQVYNDAIRFLRDIASGAVVLAGALPPTAAVAGGPVRVEAPERELGRDQLKDYTG